MLNARPLTDQFAIAYAYDPAFDHERFVDDTIQDDATRAEAAEKAYGVEYARCVQTLDFSPITLPGELPTLFVFRPLPMAWLRKLQASAHGQLAPWLAFRAALQHVERGGDSLPKLKRRVDGAYRELGELAVVSEKGTELIDILDRLPAELGRPAGDLITSIGLVVLNRSTSADPK